MYVFAFALLLLALLASLGGGGLALLQLWQGREDSLRIVEKAHVVISGALLIAAHVVWLGMLIGALAAMAVQRWRGLSTPRRRVPPR